MGKCVKTEECYNRPNTPIDGKFNINSIAVQETELPVLQIFDHPDVSPAQKVLFLNLLRKYSNLFNDTLSNLTETSLVKHHINIKNVHPIRQQPYRTNPQAREVMAK